MDDRLARVDGFTVVIQPVGDVPDRLIDAVAYAIQHELEMPAVISTAHLPLPAHTRQRGLLGGQQWEANAILLALNSGGLKFPDGPLRWVLVTAADIYIPESNFVSSVHSDTACVVSSARFAGSGEIRTCERTAKQALGSLLKSMGVRASADRNCVTSYTRSLEEFDAKGNRPTARRSPPFAKPSLG